MMVILMPLVIAATDTNKVDDVFKVNTLIDYKKPCFNNGTYCSAASTCNYTIYNPDNTLLLNNQLATNNGAYHNISIRPIVIGVYQVDMTCVDGSLNGAETYYFDITGSGFQDTVWFYVLILAISGSIMVLGFSLKDAPIVILGSFGLYFIGIYVLINGIVGIRDLTTTWATGLIILGVAFYISAKSSWELING